MEVLIFFATVCVCVFLMAIYFVLCDAADRIIAALDRIAERRDA